jgi:hypothetical protein
MHKIGEEVRTSINGYARTQSVYRAVNCNGCPLRGACHDAEGNRTMHVSHKGLRLRNEATERLLSEKGKAHRKRRCHDIETVFGNIKHNKFFRRFKLRGWENVAIETGLLAIAHNLKKFAA